MGLAPVIKRALLPAGNSMLVPLAANKGFALVSPEDAEDVGKHSWSANGQMRPQTKVAGRLVYLQQFIGERIGIRLPFEVDHIDRNVLNCRRDNLRPATRAQQCHNQPLRRDSSTGYKGVTKSGRQSWAARIKQDGQRTHLGTYRTPRDAAAAYDRAARDMFGEYAATNFATLEDEHER